LRFPAWGSSQYQRRLSLIAQALVPTGFDARRSEAPAPIHDNDCGETRSAAPEAMGSNLVELNPEHDPAAADAT
jgi:hypothetical protein